MIYSPKFIYGCPGIVMSIGICHRHESPIMLINQISDFRIDIVILDQVLNNPSTGGACDPFTSVNVAFKEDDGPSCGHTSADDNLNDITPFVSFSFARNVH